MIYDCFPFFNENDVVDIRFQELDPVVDKFVVVQANTNFRGVEKPYYFDHERFAKYEHKIIHVRVNLQHKPFFGTDTTWRRETLQRNGILEGLADALPNDIVIISDADEIARRSVIAEIDPVGIDALMMRVFSGGINMLTPNRHTIRVVRMHKMTTPEEIRKAPLDHIIENAGWEFSSLGTPEQISFKLRSFSHDELDSPEIVDPAAIRARLQRHEDVIGWGIKHEVVQIDDTWPEAIKNDRDYWSKYEWT